MNRLVILCLDLVEGVRCLPPGEEQMVVSLAERFREYVPATPRASLILAPTSPMATAGAAIVSRELRVNFCMEPLLCSTSYGCAARHTIRVVRDYHQRVRNLAVVLSTDFANLFLRRYMPLQFCSISSHIPTVHHGQAVIIDRRGELSLI